MIVRLASMASRRFKAMCKTSPQPLRASLQIKNRLLVLLLDTLVLEHSVPVLAFSPTQRLPVPALPT